MCWEGKKYIERICDPVLFPYTLHTPACLVPRELDLLVETLGMEVGE